MSQRIKPAPGMAYTPRNTDKGNLQTTVEFLQFLIPLYRARFMVWVCTKDRDTQSLNYGRLAPFNHSFLQCGGCSACPGL